MVRSWGLVALACAATAAAGRIDSADPEDQQSAVLEALRLNPFLTTTALKALPPSPLPAWFTIQPSPAHTVDFAVCWEPK